MSSVSSVQRSNSLNSWSSSPTQLSSVHHLDRRLSMKSFQGNFEKDTVTEALLSNIVDVLQKMETWMEGHDKRLTTIETLDPHPGGLKKPLPITPEDQMSYTEGDDLEEQYTKCIRPEESKFTFEDSLSDFGAAAGSKGRQADPAEPAARDNDADRWSVSVYSRDVLGQTPMLGSSQLDIHPMQPNEATPVEPTSSSTFAAVGYTAVSEQSSAEDSWTTAESRASQGSRLNAQIVFAAYRDWKHSVLSKIRGADESRERQDGQSKRLKELSQHWRSLLCAMGCWLRVKASDLKTAKGYFVPH